MKGVSVRRVLGLSLAMFLFCYGLRDTVRLNTGWALCTAGCVSVRGMGAGSKSSFLEQGSCLMQSRRIVGDQFLARRVVRASEGDLTADISRIMRTRFVWVFALAAEGCKGWVMRFGDLFLFPNLLPQGPRMS